MQSTRSASIRFCAYLAFAGLVGRHGAVGEDEAGGASGRQVVQEMLDPGEVGVALWWDAVLPALVILQPLGPPVGDVEGGIGEDVVGLEIGMAVVVEAVSLGDLRLNAPDGEVHLGHAPGGVVGLLAVYGDVGPGLADPGSESGAGVAVAGRVGLR